mmetsp:Transcript_39289/g.93061  ORF Transcript_39289/g.93061 Transcript_39289/m.93061 type:complete len:287 (+) Transcript_39289:1185-2045(+)
MGLWGDWPAARPGGGGGGGGVRWQLDPGRDQPLLSAHRGPPGALQPGGGLGQLPRHEARVGAHRGAVLGQPLPLPEAGCAVARRLAAPNGAAQRSQPGVCRVELQQPQLGKQEAQCAGSDPRGGRAAAAPVGGGGGELRLHGRLRLEHPVKPRRAAEPPHQVRRLGEEAADGARAVRAFEGPEQLRLRKGLRDFRGNAPALADFGEHARDLPPELRQETGSAIDGAGGSAAAEALEPLLDVVPEGLLRNPRHVAPDGGGERLVALRLRSLHVELREAFQRVFRGQC